MNSLESSFLQGVVRAAQQADFSFGIPASITMAQAILESGWGQSGLARKANNFFGIKAVAHLDPESYVEMPTEEVVRGRSQEEMAFFARYPTPIECFASHASLLYRAARYAPAMALRTDPAAFARQLNACGYSTLTPPTYAERLLGLVQEFDLTQYDRHAPAQEQA